MVEEKLFHNMLQLEIWLDKVLHVDDTESIYEQNQIMAGGITVPVMSAMHRNQLKKTILALLEPVLPFVTHASWCTHDASSEVRKDLLYYDGDMLGDVFSFRNGITIITFLDISGEEVVKSTLTLQDKHKQTLDMTHLYKRMVMGYLSRQTEPFDFVVSAHEFYLSSQATGDEIRMQCRDTCAYIRLFQEWERLKVQYYRKMQVLPQNAENFHGINSVGSSFHAISEAGCRL